MTVAAEVGPDVSMRVSADGRLSFRYVSNKSEIQCSIREF